MKSDNSLKVFTFLQCCSGSGFLESGPAELWDFFGSGAGLDIIFAQAGSGLSKTFWTTQTQNNNS